MGHVGNSLRGGSVFLTLKELRKAHRDEEGAFVRALLSRAGGNVSEAARIGVVNRQYLHTLIVRHKLRPKMSGRHRGGNSAWRALG